MVSSTTGSPELASRLLAGCDPDQRDAITTEARPLCVLAAAGSGKTRVLTRRIAWRVNEASASASSVLALTFTRKAASELRGRLSQLGLAQPATAGTFHAIALSELRRLASERNCRPPVVIASKARLLATAAGDTFARDRTVLANLAFEIEWAQARCLTPRDYARSAGPNRLPAATGRSTQLEPDVVAEVWKRYEREKHKRGVLDFDDLLLRCASELENDPDFAASARWRFRHIFVDEYQDVNPAQVRLLEAWLGDNDDLCVVGDPDQAIYAWNGSDPRALIDFPLRYPKARVVRLGTNYRSAEAVLAVASSVLANDAAIERDATKRGYVTDGSALHAFMPSSGSLRTGPTPRSTTAYETDLEEARGVVSELKRARDPGAPWSSIAVLARTNAQLVLFEQELRASSIPFRGGAGRSFLSRPSVREALARLAGPSGAPNFHTWLEELSPADDIDLDSDDQELKPSPADEDLAELANLALEYLQADSCPNASGFVPWLEASLRSDPGALGADAVDLLSFHRSKGLEWRVVFVTGLEDGLVPIAHARTQDALAEERRLLYVACTRAIDDLRCSWARERSFGNRRSARKPSPYLAAIETTQRDFARLAEMTPERARSSRRALSGLLAHRQGQGPEC
jgi:DNA helicase-2/ATP-dependent DNA helicase PcrA